MSEVLQARLAEFANTFREPAFPGVELIETPRYRIKIEPDYPIPGPNHAAWIRCAASEADDVIAEVRAIFTARRLPLMWILDPDTEPADFPDRLAAHDIHLEPHAPEVAVMIVGIGGSIERPSVPGLELHDALADAARYRAADMVNAEGFGNPERDPAAQDRRRANQLAAGNRRVLLATIDGEPAGSGTVTLYAPGGAIMNGAAVRDKFRGRGVYRALVAERLRIAREAGAAGLVVWGGHMSAPILGRLGFEKVGWRRFYLDRLV